MGTERKPCGEHSWEDAGFGAAPGEPGTVRLTEARRRLASRLPDHEAPHPVRSQRCADCGALAVEVVGTRVISMDGGLTWYRMAGSWENAGRVGAPEPFLAQDEEDPRSFPTEGAPDEHRHTWGPVAHPDTESVVTRSLTDALLRGRAIATAPWMQSCDCGARLFGLTVRGSTMPDMAIQESEGAAWCHAVGGSTAKLKAGEILEVEAEEPHRHVWATGAHIGEEVHDQVVERLSEEIDDGHGSFVYACDCGAVLIAVGDAKEGRQAIRPQQGAAWHLVRGAITAVVDGDLEVGELLWEEGEAERLVKVAHDDDENEPVGDAVSIPDPSDEVEEDGHVHVWAQHELEPGVLDSVGRQLEDHLAMKPGKVGGANYMSFRCDGCYADKVEASYRGHTAVAFRSARTPVEPWALATGPDGHEQPGERLFPEKEADGPHVPTPKVAGRDRRSWKVGQGDFVRPRLLAPKTIKVDLEEQGNSGIPHYSEILIPEECQIRLEPDYPEINEDGEHIEREPADIGPENLADVLAMLTVESYHLDAHRRVLRDALDQLLRSTPEEIQGLIREAQELELPEPRTSEEVAAVVTENFTTKVWARLRHAYPSLTVWEVALALVAAGVRPGRVKELEERLEQAREARERDAETLREARERAEAIKTASTENTILARTAIDALGPLAEAVREFMKCGPEGKIDFRLSKDAEAALDMWDSVEQQVDPTKES